MNWARAFITGAIIMLGAATAMLIVTGETWPYWIAVATLGVAFILGDVRRSERNAAPRHAVQSASLRPDADVAQYLNDGDRAWLMEHGDWTDPATRIVERPSSASGTLAADRKRRAEQVVSQIDSTDGWRTTRYADGRTVEHAVTDEAPDPGPVPDGDYETIVDGFGRPVRYVQT